MFKATEAATKEEREAGTICQNCKWHTNRPSFCRGLDTFVGRKDTCPNFKAKA